MQTTSIPPNRHVVLQLASGLLKVVLLVPDTQSPALTTEFNAIRVISLGKYGTIPVNLILGRPFYATFELLDDSDEAINGTTANAQQENDTREDSGPPVTRLRIVPASELHAEALFGEEKGESERDVEDETEASNLSENEEDLASHKDDNRNDVSPVSAAPLQNAATPSVQSLTHAEIEALKSAAPGASGRTIIAKLMASHTALDAKTKYALAKYHLRKSKKFLKRFIVFPLNISTLVRWISEGKGDAARIMDLREEVLGLFASWANIRKSDSPSDGPLAVQNNVQAFPESRDGEPKEGRWLVVDETGGAIVALLAERMGVLYPEDDAAQSAFYRQNIQDRVPQPDSENVRMDVNVPISIPAQKSVVEDDDVDMSYSFEPDNTSISSKSRRDHHQAHVYADDASTATSNTITLLHSSTQPNLSLLSYFTYDINNSETHSTLPSPPNVPHPLHRHLKMVSFLQLMEPLADPSYSEPPDHVEPSKLAQWKSSKRGTFHRKRRRWERTRRIVDETRAGNFDGLFIATYMDLKGIVQATVPLLKGGAQVVCYSKDLEPLVELCDIYSTQRKTAFINECRRLTEEQALVDSSKARRDDQIGSGQNVHLTGTNGSEDTDGSAMRQPVTPLVPSDDFPVDPRLLLAPSLQTVRAREWQVLPGRTHPLMTARGGAEGYLFTATRVLPTSARVEARGRFSKKRKATSEDPALTTPQFSEVHEKYS